MPRRAGAAIQANSPGFGMELGAGAAMTELGAWVMAMNRRRAADRGLTGTPIVAL